MKSFYNKISMLKLKQKVMVDKNLKRNLTEKKLKSKQIYQVNTNEEVIQSNINMQTGIKGQTMQGKGHKVQNSKSTKILNSQKQQ